MVYEFYCDKGLTIETSVLHPTLISCVDQVLISFNTTFTDKFLWVIKLFQSGKRRFSLERSALLQHLPFIAYKELFQTTSV